MEFIKLQTQLYAAMLAAPPESLSYRDRQILALLAAKETDG